MICSAISSAIASEKMVFLVESEQGKHVGISSDFNNYKLETKDDKWHLYPSISSDGESIAYVEGFDPQKLQLVIEKNNNKRVIGNEAFQLQPRFAKNDKLVFISKSIAGKNRIIKYDLTQANPTAEIAAPGEGYFPAPFINGEKLIYQRNSEKREIVLLNFINNEEKVLDEGMAPSLSKDERFVAYTKKVNNNWDIYVFDLFTDKIQRVTTNPARDFSPEFDREQNLFYTSDRKEENVFSIYSQTKDSWKANKNDESLHISKKGVSFYAPRISGNIDIKIEHRADMIGNSRSSFGAIAHNDRVYVAGGHQGAEHTYPPESFTGRVDFFDLKTKKWTNTAPRNYEAHGFSLAAYKNYIYAFGGFAYDENNYPKWKSLDVVERYDIEKGVWEEIGKMPRRRSSNVVAQANGKAYLIGGWDATPKHHGDLDGTFHDEIDVFDFETETFITLDTKLPKKRRAFTGFSKDGVIYLAGGISEGASHFNLLDDFTAFDPITESFTELPKLPFATFAPAAGAVKESAFVFGGMLKTGEWEYEYISHIYSYDYNKQAWSHTGRYLKEDKGFSQVVKLKDALGVLGGHSYQNNTDEPVKSFEILKL